MKISQLTLDTGNANRGTDRGRKALAESLKTYGAGRSILVDKKGRVIAGNKTLEQAIAQGHKDILIVKTDGSKLVAVQRMDLSLSDKRAKALAIADNRVGELDLEWDAAVLAELGKDIDLSAFWDAKELELLLGEESCTSEAPEAKINQAEALQKRWKTRLGQIWAIPSESGNGNHRLMCGDATDSDQRSRLLSGAKPILCFTSPPYAAQRTYKIGEFDWDALMDGVFLSLDQHLAEDASILVNLGMVHNKGSVFIYWQNWLERMAKAGSPLYGWYVWDQGWGLPGDWAGRLAPCFEFIFHFAKKPRHTNKTVEASSAGKVRNSTFRHKNGELKPFTGNGEASGEYKVADSVVRVNRQIGSVGEGDHPAVFSVGFPAHCIPIWTEIGEVIYEPFCGSASTIIAAEQTKRLCCGTEISPEYVAVALERLSDMGLKPKLSAN